MKNKIKGLVKYCKPIYFLYYYLGTGFLNLLRLFLKTDERLILFNSYGGKSFDDSPRVLYEQMKKDPRFKGFRLVWAFQDDCPKEAYGVEWVKADTFRYFVWAIKAACWITNSSMERGLGFRGKNTWFVNTWHGTPLKKMGLHIVGGNTSFKSRNSWNMDLMTVQSAWEGDIFTSAFQLKEGICQPLGLPRNDRLAHTDEEEKARIREKLAIGREKKVLLYAPTFREYNKNTALQCVFSPKADFDLWAKALGEEGLILVRAHYETVREMKMNFGDGVRDMSDWPDLAELMIASDLLVSDYSSVFVDYSILGRPMISYCYDYLEYERMRGLYIDIREYLPYAESEEGLLALLRSLTDPLAQADMEEKTQAFKEAFVENAGNAAGLLLDKIWKNRFQSPKA